MDNLIFGLSTTAIGIVVVFVGLVVLIVCITCMRALTGGKPKVASVPQERPAPVPEPVEEEDDQEDGAIIAAITAAIAAVWQQEGQTSGFVVRRVRRIQTSTARARSARDEQIFSRQ